MQYAFRQLKRKPYNRCTESEKQRRIGVAKRCIEQGFKTEFASGVANIPIELIFEEPPNVPNNISQG